MTVLWTVRAATDRATEKRRNSLAFSSPWWDLIPPSAPTKRELLSTKSSLFVYPSRRLGISSPHNVRCISSRSASRPCISSRAGVHLPAAWWYPDLRSDDIPQQVADDIHAFGVIGTRDYGKFLNYFAKYDRKMRVRIWNHIILIRQKIWRQGEGYGLL